MIESLTIEGFRGIEALEVPRCGRINVVVGRNGSGKTRLLEAAFALMFRANAEVFPSLAKLRGVPPELPAALVVDYYRDSFATRGQPEATVEGGVGGLARKVTLRHLPGELAELAAPGAAALAVFEMEIREGHDGGSHAHQGYVLSDGRWWIPRARPLSGGAPVRLRTPKRLSHVAFLARQWSAVEQHGARSRELVLTALRGIDPMINDIRVVALDNGVAQVRVDYGDLGLCPVELLGDGLVEAMHYLTMLVSVAGGVMLVDEFGAPADDLLVLQMNGERGAVSVEVLEHDEAKALRDDLGFDLRRVA